VVECKLLDLSLGGAQISADMQLPEKFQLQFELEVLGVKHAFDIETQIRKRKDTSDEPGVLRYGVTFAELPPAQQLAMHAWIGDELVQRYECPFIDAA
jgi:c-di-GMP-binding flagellar brake protein YcgR